MDDQAIKVLFFGVFSENSTNISQANAFEKNGCKVIRHDFRANSQLPADEGYDLIFYSKCNELGIDAITKYSGIKCLWYMDPLNGNYSQSFINKLRMVDFACFALYKPWQDSRHYNTPCYLIEEGFDPDVDTNFNDVLSNDPEKWFKKVEPFKYDVSFIGNLYDEKRKKYHKEIGFDLIKCSRLEHPIKVKQSRINLNFTDGGTSDRAYKIMAVEGFLLSESWPGCPFIDGEEFVSFDSPKDLKEKIKYYFEETIEWIIIFTRGYLAVQKYSRTNWAKRILDIYKKCKS